MSRQENFSQNICDINEVPQMHIRQYNDSQCENQRKVSSVQRSKSELSKAEYTKYRLINQQQRESQISVLVKRNEQANKDLKSDVKYRGVQFRRNQIITPQDRQVPKNRQGSLSSDLRNKRNNSLTDTQFQVLQPNNDYESQNIHKSRSNSSLIRIQFQYTEQQTNKIIQNPFLNKKQCRICKRKIQLNMKNVKSKRVCVGCGQYVE